MRRSSALYAAHIVVILVVFVAGSPVARAQGQFTVLHKLKGRNFGEGEVASGFGLDAHGNVIGLAALGGTTANWGAIFKLETNGTYVALHNFSGPPNDGTGPNGKIVFQANGDLFGVTGAGGNGPCLYGCGTVFKLGTRGALTLLYQFQAASDGAGPFGGLIRDAMGNLYGVTQGAGNLGGKCFIYAGCGTIFKVNTKRGKLTTVHRFNWHDGMLPWGGLVIDAGGNLYGATEYGGVALCKSGFQPAPGCGTIFRFDNTGKLTVLHVFKEKDGKFPLDVTLDDSGNIYGVTFKGGASDLGEVFKLDTSGKFSVLHSFTGPDGELPGGLVFNNGKIIGSVGGGGDLSKCGAGCGTLFEMDADGGNFKVLHTFENSPDGAFPSIFLTLDGSGKIYGGTGQGGTIGNNNKCSGVGCGTIFSLTP